MLGHADGNQLRNAGLLHGDAVEGLGGFHGGAAVGNQDELRAFAHVAHQTREACQVRFVERGVDLVEHAKTGWAGDGTSPSTKQQR